MGLGLRLWAALHVAGEATLDVEAIHQDPMATAGADQTDVGAQPYDSPLSTPTRVLAPQADHVADAQIDRRHRH
jgi:hypothetical protein